MIQRLLNGFQFFIGGWRLLRSHRQLWAFVLVPFAINSVFFISGMIYGLGMIPGLITSALGLIFTTPDGFWYSLAYYPLVIVFGLVFIVSISALAYLTSSVVAAPFNGILAEKVLVIKGVLKEQPFQMTELLKNSVKMLGVSLLRAVILVSVSAILFLLSFIPGLNVMAAFLTLIILAFDASDYAMESLQMSLQQRLAFLRNNFAEYTGMAAQLALFLLIPGVVVLLMPIMVIGAADQVAQRRLLDPK